MKACLILGLLQRCRYLNRERFKICAVRTYLSVLMQKKLDSKSGVTHEFVLDMRRQGLSNGRTYLFGYYYRTLSLFAVLWPPSLKWQLSIIFVLKEKSFSGTYLKTNFLTDLKIMQLNVTSQVLQNLLTLLTKFQKKINYGKKNRIIRFWLWYRDET